MFAAVTASSWGVAEVLTISGERVSLKDLAVPALVLAIAVAGYRAFAKYRKYVPDALSGESKATQRIYRNGRSGWQCALARQMLAERLVAADRTLDRVGTGAEFIRVNRLTLQEYNAWLRDRPANFSRLVHSVAVQCTSELPSVIASIRSESQLAELKAGVDQLTALYMTAADFEVECHSVHPPEPLEELHKMTHGWSAPIRDGVRELMTILAEWSAVDRKAIRVGARMPTFNIDFKPPENLTRFIRELEALDINAVVEAELSL